MKTGYVIALSALFVAGCDDAPYLGAPHIEQMEKTRAALSEMKVGTVFKYKGDAVFVVGTDPGAIHYIKCGTKFDVWHQPKRPVQGVDTSPKSSDLLSVELVASEEQNDLCWKTTVAEKKK